MRGYELEDGKSTWASYHAKHAVGVDGRRRMSPAYWQVPVYCYCAERRGEDGEGQNEDADCFCRAPLWW